MRQVAETLSSAEASFILLEDWGEGIIIKREGVNGKGEKPSFSLRGPLQRRELQKQLPSVPVP